MKEELREKASRDASFTTSLRRPWRLSIMGNLSPFLRKESLFWEKMILKF